MDYLSTDIYLELLKFGRKNSLNGSTDEELLKFSLDIGCLTNAEYEEISAYRPREISDSFVNSLAHRKKFALYRIYDEIFKPAAGQVGRCTLTVDGYFKLLEHEELELARENAKSARTFSLLAIAISFASLVAALFFSNQPITLKEAQYQGITSISTDLRSVVDRMEKLEAKVDELVKATKSIDKKTNVKKSKM